MTELAQSLLHGIKKFLSWTGIPRDMLDQVEEIIFLILIVIIAFIFAVIVHAVMARFTRKILKRKNASFLHSLAKYNVLRKLTAVIPPLIISALLPFAFDSASEWYIVSSKVT